MKEPVLRTENLYFRYSTREEYALRAINIEIFGGEFVAFIGQNGCGKTTLLKHFNGLLRPTQGKVFLYGQDTAGIPTCKLASKVGYVFQNPDHQIFADTVREEIAFGPKNLGFDQSRIESITKDVLKAVGLEEYIDCPPFSLGKGQRQRLAIAAVLAMEPDILIIDEPTTGQDWHESIQIMELLRELNSQGHTIIITSHNMQLVSLYARRVVLMANGEIWMDGTPQQVFSDPDRLREVYIKAPMLYQLAHRFCPNADLSRVVTPEDLADLLYDQIYACRPSERGAV